MEEIIQSRQAYQQGSYEQYTLPDGRVIEIGRNDLDFFYQLQNLPVATRIEMMKLSEEDVMYHFELLQKIERNKLIDLLRNRWYWRETGEEVERGAELLEGLTQDQMLKHFKSKKQIPLKHIRTFIDFFEGDRAEVYWKP